ncbi:alpha/beta hydrolase [Larkinella terrae]|uniref:Alpha/beta fold hydrolase n=1 Tax=Larkinella terrae TaxID=2025311 RepID=A0A7K0EJA5_9BACT|nr:alpha/beta fold hydrolase [Larkinella terrae]MRS61933.1 alpha/beta fold hydrolase [Larkinella terrae]
MLILRRTGLVLLVLFLLLNIITAFQASRFTYFYNNPDKTPPRKPEEYTTGEKFEAAFFGVKLKKSVVNEQPGIPFETIRLTNEYNQKLEGWYIPAENPKGTVILCHGHASNKSRILCETEYFHELGYNTLSFDFRAHGNSEGNICTIGFRETNDLKAAYDFVVKGKEKNIILWGVSMGAATILKAIPEHGLKPAQVILECPFASLYDAVQGRLRSMHIPAHPIAELLTLWGGMERSMWAFGYRPAVYAKQLSMPVLLNWGAKDPRVLRHETDAIFENLGTSRKQLVVFENSAHQSYCVNEKAKWQAAVSGFLQVSPKPESKPVAEHQN